MAQAPKKVEIHFRYKNGGAKMIDKLKGNEINLYANLGVAQSASSPEIEAANELKKALGSDYETNARRSFKFAYYILSDSSRKAEYDAVDDKEAFVASNEKHWKEYEAVMEAYKKAYGVAVDLLAAGKSIDSTAANLEQQGVPKAIAVHIAKKASDDRKMATQFRRSEGFSSIGKAILYIAGGIALSIASYFLTAIVGFPFFFLFWGLSVYGIVLLFRSIAYLFKK
jgi:hypothetical protein